MRLNLFWYVRRLWTNQCCVTYAWILAGRPLILMMLKVSSLAYKSSSLCTRTVPHLGFLNQGDGKAEWCDCYRTIDPRLHFGQDQALSLNVKRDEQLWQYLIV